MFTLQRNGNIYQVCKEDAEILDGDASRRTEVHDMFHPAPKHRPRYEQWKRFVERGQLNGLRLHDALLQSWKRCRELEVDPSARQCLEFTPMAQLEPFASLYQELAGDAEKRLYPFLRDKNLLITMTDSAARVIRTCGPKDILIEADKLNFGPGATWAESSVGTNAIGTALASGIPLQVLGEEHYCRSHHAWSCAAAPIFDPHGNLWGCFDISGPVQADHSHSLRLVVGAAREIERKLFQAYLSDFEIRSRSLLTAFCNTVQAGILAVDNQGRITYSNQTAEILLRQHGSLVGRSADEFVDYELFLIRQGRNPACDEPMALACRANPRLLAQATPLFGHGPSWNHAVITLADPSHASMHKAAARIAPSSRTSRPQHFGEILYASPLMAQTVRRARQAANTPSTLLLLGETGTGKELFARAIHAESARANGPFVAVNCGAFPRELIQSELFGYKSGAFTGAQQRGRLGKFQQADKGTLFLDEISEMPLDMQVNLLRPLEERCVVRVGGDRPWPVDIKVIVASNRDLSALVHQGQFRQDLFYRINVVSLHIPPLRQRKEDIPLLAEYFARKCGEEFRRPVSHLTRDVTERLLAYSWPGNVRELLHCMEYAVNIMEGDTIGLEHLPPTVLGEGSCFPEAPCLGIPAQEATDSSASLGILSPPPISCEPSQTGPAVSDNEGFRLRDVTADTIREALAFHGGNISRTAKALGIGRNTLYAKLRKFGLRT